MSESIGDNSLIKSILATRISETPTKKVEEVEIPMPEMAEAIQPPLTVEATPEPPPIDYAEYDEEPARIQKEEPLNLNEQIPKSGELLPNISPERKERQRQISSRWGVRLYDKLQGLAAIVAYDRLNTPADYIKKRNDLLDKVYEDTISDKEREELKSINGIVDSFMSRRTTFHESVHMSQDLINDISELVEELMIESDTNIHPMWILVTLLLIQPVINAVTALTHKMQYNTRF